MAGHEFAARYEAAISLFERHLDYSEGKIKLFDEHAVEQKIDDPVVFADLKRSLAHTNEMIQAGQVKAEDVLLSKS